MKRTISAVLLLVAVVGLSGCASVYTVASHDKEVISSRAMELKAIPGGAAISFDLLQLGTGYFATWADNPGKMAGATLLDLVTGAGLYLGGKELADQQDGGQEAPTTLNINGNGNTLIFGDGTGTASNQQNGNM